MNLKGEFVMCKKMVFVILLLGIVGSTFADTDWYNTAGDRDWDNASNWSAGVPTAADKAGIRHSAPGPIIDSSTAAVANILVVGDFSSSADTLAITGGSLTTNSWFTLGYSAGNDGTFDVSGGVTTCNQNLTVGRAGAGAINMTSGTVSVSGVFGLATTGGSGDVQLDGGTISCASFTMATGATMDITGGTLIVDGDATSTINGYIGNGWITADGGAGTLNVDYNVTNPGKTTVTAFVPEKASAPSPADGANHVSIDADLSWTEGIYATSHDVYFGTNPTPGAGEFIGNQPGTTYDPGTMELNTTYYWRIDEVDTGNPESPWVGNVWSFTTQDTLPRTEGPPNIIFILADDVGWGDLSCYGHPHTSTPELDQLATDGTRFEKFYVTGITCNPSRAGFMTSRHPASYVGETSAQGFADRATVTELLHKGGYKVGHFGKWHIGPVEKTGTYGIDDLQVLAGNNSTTAGRDAILNAAARDFIEANKDVPFYVNVWGHISHSPVDPHDDLVALFDWFTLNRDDYNYGSYWQQDKFDLAQAIIDHWSLPEDLTMGMRNYMADIWAMDVQIGLLLDKIDELGLRGITIVVFSSDQGAAPVWTVAQIQEDETKDPDICKNMLGTGGPYSGGKHTQLEGGVRVPFIVRWPENVPDGVVNNTSTISGLDWLPTMCSFAGIDIGSLEVEGQDVSDILLGATRSPDRALFWKTHVANSPPSMLEGLEGRWKMHSPLVASSNPDELFDLDADPEELIDVLSENPSIAGSMSAAIDDWLTTLPMSEFDNEPPVTPNSPIASAGADREVYDLDSNGAEPVTLDGSGSSDPDGYISGYIWRESGQIIGHTDGPTVNLSLGVHTIEVEVTDYAGNTDFDTVTITVSTLQTCGDETCDPGEDQCNCPDDCGTPPSTETSCTDGIDNDCDTYTDCDDSDCDLDPACSCGNGTCDPGEDCHTCSEDCISRTSPPKFAYCCGDGTCEGAENETNCAVDCGGGSYCGDETCDPGEDQCNCPDDCGTPPSTETSCTDEVDNDCDTDVDCDDSDCIGDPACPTCGDETCDPGEDQCNCPEDCGTPPSTETSCTDEVDNDCDTYVDCDDSDCDGDPACPSCGEKGDPCTEDADCCSNDCNTGRGICK